MMVVWLYGISHSLACLYVCPQTLRLVLLFVITMIIVIIIIIIVIVVVVVMYVYVCMSVSRDGCVVVWDFSLPRLPVCMRQTLGLVLLSLLLLFVLVMSGLTVC